MAPEGWGKLTQVGGPCSDPREEIILAEDGGGEAWPGTGLARPVEWE